MLACSQSFVRPPQTVRFFTIMCLFSSDVKKEMDDLSITMKNFEARVGFAKNLETMSAVSHITAIRLTDETFYTT